MSNADRVMRLPATVNYPKAEKLAKGQVEALARIIKDYQTKCDILRYGKASRKLMKRRRTALKRSMCHRPIRTGLLPQGQSLLPISM
jgi:hypothetical protein